MKYNYTLSSGNVFEDIGLENPEEHLAKSELAIQINKIIKKRNLTKKAVADLFGIDQLEVSALSKGKLSGFSLEKLFRILNILGQEITINVSPKRRTKSATNISMTKIKHKPVTLQANPRRISAKKRK